MRNFFLRHFTLLIACCGLSVMLIPWSGLAQDGDKKADDDGGKGGPGKGGFGKGGAGVGGKGKKGNFGGRPGGEPAVEIVLPEGLRQVPADAAAFVHIRVADSLNGPPSLALIKQLRPDGDHGKFVEQIEKRLGVRLADLESVTLFVLDAPGTPGLPPLTSKSAVQPTKGFGTNKPAQPPSATEKVEPSIDMDAVPACLVALAYSKPVDRNAVLKALANTSNPPLWPSLSGMFLSDRCVLFGSAAELLNYSTRLRGSSALFDDGSGPFVASSRLRGSLHDQLAAGAEPHLIVAGAQVPAAARTRLKLTLRGVNVGALGALLPLLQTNAGVTLDMRDAADIVVRFNGGDRLTLEAVEAMRTLAVIALDADDAKGKSEGPVTLSPAMQRALRKGIANATIEQAGASRVEMRVRLEVGPDEAARFLAQTVAQTR